MSVSARILLVEDDPIEARRLVSLLEGLSYACVVAPDGDAALACLARETFAAVLLDLVLPGLDGMGVLRALATRPSAPPVVAMVTPGGIDAVDSALNAGAQDFVVKPAGALRIKVSLRNAISAARAVEGSGATLLAFPAPAPDPLDLSLTDAGGHARPLAQIEREAITAAVALYGGRMSEVARRLGIGRSTLYRRVGELGLALPEPVARLSVAAE